MKNTTNRTALFMLGEIEKWAETYDFSFQFWGTDNNQVYIKKGDVELWDTGNCKNITDALYAALEYIERINPSKTQKANQ